MEACPGWPSPSSGFLGDPWGSQAKLTHTSPSAEEDEFPVLQSGPRRLWNEVEAACYWWLEAGSAGADRWLFTVTREGQGVELTDVPSMVGNVEWCAPTTTATR
jgi:hypothetical protein